LIPVSLIPVSLIPAANLLPYQCNDTSGIPVAKFAAGLIDTGGEPTLTWNIENLK
jgi:hypothetical protein